MRRLVFDVRGQTLSKNPSCDFGNIVSGTDGYLKAKFNFYGNDWNKCKKAASFWLDGEEYGALLDPSDSCFIPREALKGKSFDVSVTGVGPDYKIVTTKITVEQEVV